MDSRFPVVSSDFISNFERKGYHCPALKLNIDVDRIFDGFERVIDFTYDPNNTESVSAIDNALVSSSRGRPGASYSTIRLDSIRIETDKYFSYGYQYFLDTYRQVSLICDLPAEVSDFWVQCDNILKNIDNVVKSEFPHSQDIQNAVSMLKVWKYVPHKKGEYLAYPHYDRSILSAILASINPQHELLAIGSEGNGTPIQSVGERIGTLNEFRPSEAEMPCFFPGLHGNILGVNPTWHYVDQMSESDIARFSLIYFLNPLRGSFTKVKHISGL